MSSGQLKHRTVWMLSAVQLRWVRAGSGFAFLDRRLLFLHEILEILPIFQGSEIRVLFQGIDSFGRGEAAAASRLLQQLDGAPGVMVFQPSSLGVRQLLILQNRASRQRKE